MCGASYPIVALAQYPATPFVTDLSVLGELTLANRLDASATCLSRGHTCGGECSEGHGEGEEKGLGEEHGGIATEE